MVANKLKEMRRALGLTLDELAERVGTSKQTIHRYENGTITNIPHAKVESLARALGCTPAELMGWRDGEGSGKRLPVLGRIACGIPILANEEYGEFVTVNEELNADFCLIAKGDSMIGARIMDSDTVFIKSQLTVENGQIAAVIIDDEATLKRVYFYPNEQKLILSAENPKYAPRVFVGEELSAIRIIGRAVAFQSRVI